MICAVRYCTVVLRYLNKVLHRVEVGGGGWEERGDEMGCRPIWEVNIDIWDGKIVRFKGGGWRVGDYIREN